jgi:hypothetical protein
MADDRLAAHRLVTVRAAIERAMADDPQRVAVDGDDLPYGVHYARRMTHWLGRLVATPSEALAIAVHGQHVRRYDIPRDRHPMDKPGYLAWRNALKAHHADLVAGVMAAAGYDADTIGRARSIVMKERLKRDPEAQALEDCACLVFLENEFAGFVAKKADYDDDKWVAIVAKTWAKMSPAGHALALELVPALPEKLKGLVARAVSG